jgi:integrase
MLDYRVESPFIVWEDGMSVMKRGKSKYWYIQFQLNGRTYIKSSKTTEKKMAETMEADWRKQLIQQQVLGVKEKISVKLAMSMYAESKQELASYTHIVRNAVLVSEMLEKKRFLDEVTSGDLERIRIERQQAGYSNQTIKHIIGVVRGAVKYTARMGYQVPAIEYPKIVLPKGKLRYLSFEEEQRLLKVTDPRRPIKGMPAYGKRPPDTQREMDDLYDFIVMLLDTGARYSELATLTWQRIDLAEKAILLWRPKVNNESVLYMTDRVFDILRSRILKKTSDFVFKNRSGAARTYIASTLRRMFARAGLSDCTAHTLRHTHATRLIQNGLSLYEVKEILGHADIRTTMRYAHIEQRTVSIKAREVIDRLNKEQQKPDLRLVK